MSTRLVRYYRMVMYHSSLLFIKGINITMKELCLSSTHIVSVNGTPSVSEMGLLVS